jgi:hypothetical protein
LLRKPEPTLKAISNKNAYDYYRFRLRKLYSYSKLAQNSICITYDDLINRSAFTLIEQFLGIKEPISNYYDPWSTDSGDLASGQILSIPNTDTFIPLNSDKYERYLNAIRRRCIFG